MAKKKAWNKGRKNRRWGKVASHPRRVAGGIFGLASRDKAYKNAKKRADAAKRKASAAYKKAVSKAKKKVRSKR